MMKRVLSVAIGMIVVGTVPTLAGGDSSYTARQKDTPFYTGAVVGYGFGRISVGGLGSINTSGAMGGAVMGYRAFTGNAGIAIEGDIMGTNIDREGYGNARHDDGNTYTQARVREKYLASLRLKGSWGDSALRPYLTGGIAWQRLTAELNGFNTASRQRVSESAGKGQFGLTIGTGIDWQTDSAYSVSLGYHYYRFSDDDHAADITTDLHTIRLSGKLHY